MKKLLSYLLIAIMAISMVACGSKAEKTEHKENEVKTEANAVEVLTKAIDNFDAVSAVEANLTVAGSTKVDGEALEVKASLDFLANNLGKDNMEIKIPLKLSLTGEQDIEATLYYKDAVIYADTAALLGQSLKLDLDLSELIPDVSAVAPEVGTEMTEEEEAKIEDALNLTIKESEDGSFVLTMDVDYDKYVALMSESLSAEELSATEMTKFNKFQMTISATKDGVMKSASMDVDATVDVEGTVVDVSIKGNLEFKANKVDIEFPDFSNYMDASLLLNQLMGQF